MTASAAPSVGQLAFGDLAHELTLARRMLERVPDDRLDWAPHAKSMSLGALATHLAEVPNYALMILGGDEIDFGARPYVPPKADTSSERLALFDRGAAEWRAAVDAVDTDALARTWTMRKGDHVIMSRPKGALLRSMGVSHLIHHRAQLGVYLRLLDVPVPATYGPSADEKM